MSPEEHAAELAEVVKTALECDPQHRQSFLDERCRFNPELGAEVESLLELEPAARDLMRQSAHEKLAGILWQTETELQPGQCEREYKIPTLLSEGEIIGDYEVVSLIDRGGMGEVYLARDRQLHRKVALKLIRRG